MVQGLIAYPSIAEVPGPVDCAIVALPAVLVADALEACAGAGVKSAVVFSAGFAEADPEGVLLQARVSEVARRSGLRVVGPNCLGIFNAAANFYATFSSSIDGGLPPPGHIAIISQSGAYGSHVFALARAKGLGVRYWITTGNEVDVEIGECIAWAALAEDVRVIVAYAEGARDRTLLLNGLELARARGKPVIFMKVGRSEVGIEAVASHTAALAGTDAIYSAVFRQYGVYRARSTEDMLDAAYACGGGIYPQGRRLGLMTISGGVGVQMADDAADLGLDVAPMPAAAQARLKEILPFAAPCNPVDVTAQAFNDLSLVEQNFEIMIEEGGYDAIVAFLTMVAASPYIVDDLLATLSALRARHPDRLIVLSLFAAPDILARYEAAGYLVFEDPCRAVAATAALVGFGESFARARAHPPAPPSALPGPLPPLPEGPPSEREAKALLAAAGLPVVAERLARDAEAGADAARELGLPVALKLSAPGLAHKTEIGGVLLNVATPEPARDGFETLRTRAAAAGVALEGVLVAPMVVGGVETILGVQRDPLFGPAVMFGLGGVFVEVLGDVAFRLAPFGLDEAHRMSPRNQGLHGAGRRSRRAARRPRGAGRGAGPAFGAGGGGGGAHREHRREPLPGAARGPGRGRARRPGGAAPGARGGFAVSRGGRP